MNSGRIYVTESQIICGSRDGTANVLYPHSTYTHPSTIQCSAATEISNLKSSVSNGKTQVANAITGKGVSASQNDTFATLASKINSIFQLDTSDATANASQILSGSTAYVNGSKVTGTMTNIGAVNQSLNCGGSYTIPAGYHNGSGKIIANSLASQTSATATASQILSGYTAWVNGSKLTGTASVAKTTVSSISTNSTWYGYSPTVSSFDGTRLVINLYGTAQTGCQFILILS